MSFIPFAKIEQTTRLARENLIFFSSANLITVVSDALKYSKDCRQECIAELIIRWYLNPVAEIEHGLDTIFPAKEWHALKKIKEQEFLSVSTVVSLPEELWAGRSLFSSECELATRKRLAELLATDGFIPVYFEQEAFFLPFRFVESDETRPLIGDCSGEPIENWIDPYKSLFDKQPRYRCIVSCRQKECLPPLTGHSLKLPLFLAFKRKTGELPRYNPLRLLSTGAIEHGHLKAVKTEEKKRGLGMCFQNAYLFFPEDAKKHSEEKYAIPLNITFDLPVLLEEIRKQIEAKGLVIPTFHDAIERLFSLDYETRHDNLTRGEVMLERLQTNMDAIPQERAPESRLLCLMLKSAIYCHMGDTARAIKINEEAKAEAKRLKLERYLRRLEIEELVDLQDVEDFKLICGLSVTLKDNIEQLNDNDLQMRYYGTMGQAHCYGFLAGIPEFDPNTAKECFEKAMHHAFKLNSEPDIAQDLNYRYLWYVLFDPASAEAVTAYKAANDHIERNLRTYPQCQKKNRFFLHRLKMQALYRRLLAGEQISGLDYQSEDLPEEAVFWLRALVKKYLGALTAANGERELAGRYFHDAVQALEQEPKDNIIAFIRMTIHAEAYRSLGKTEDKSAALQLLRSIQPKNVGTSDKWKLFLKDNAGFPGLSYWY